MARNQPPLHDDETRAHGLGVLMADPIPTPVPALEEIDNLRAINIRLCRENHYLRQALDDALARRLEG